MLFLIALSACCTVACAVLALANRPPNPVRARARALGESALPGAPDYDPFSTRVVLPLARGAAGGLLKLLPNHWLQRLERMLIAAGDPIDLGSFFLMWVVLIIITGTVGGVLLSLRGLVIGAALGALLPYLWLRRRVQRRRRSITNALPDAIDLLVTCVEAGLGLDAAMMRVSEAAEGPLGEEIGITLRQISVGRPRQEALLDLGSRSGVPDLDGFIRPIIQAERGGVSIGATLRVQAESLRVRRYQRAQEFAQKLPVKMTVPIGLFFIPAVLLIGIGPAVVSFSDFVSGR